MRDLRLPPEHDADHCKADEGGDGGGIALEVSRKATVAADPGEGALYDPPLRQNREAASSGALYDLQFPGSGAPDDARHLASGIAAIGENAFDEREQPPRPAQQAQPAVTILNVGRMHDDIQQEAHRVDQDVPLATFDLLARVVARRIEQRPPF